MQQKQVHSRQHSYEDRHLLLGNDRMNVHKCIHATNLDTLGCSRECVMGCIAALAAAVAVAAATARLT